ncbi:MAG: hypothetical protein M1821_010010 [Bathelium mastoideum]|nr:MAG: hypothetical protein M1821_010010 [Bathelium mastoideum]KAI9690219.1 MAG: hypothetical protein M1822_009180 [Bathelium mastoideum]
MSSADTSKVECIAICTVPPEKLQRFKELASAFISTVETHEPDALRFQMVEELDTAEPQFVMVESYTSMEVVKAHADSSRFKELFGKFEEEKLLAKPPLQILGKAVAGFTR